MSARGPPRDGHRLVFVAIGVGTLVALTAIALVVTHPGPSTPPSSSLSSATVTNETRSLGSTFHPGAILCGGSNGSATFLGGIGVYLKPKDFSLPVLALAEPRADGPDVRNITPLVNSYFWQGGIYSIVWNGSAWLLTGQAGWGGVNTGSAVLIQGTRLTNLTPLLGNFFPGGGIWTAGWNGTAWLLGGNSTAGPVLLSLQGGRVAELTSVVRWHDPHNWFQYMEWNGQEWLLAGDGILGLLRGSVYVDLFPGSPYVGGGVYSGGWNGSAWLVGGGSGAVSVIAGNALYAGPALPLGLEQSILAIQPVGSGWIIAGKGSTPTGGIAPGLAYWNGTSDPGSVRDLSAQLPGSFLGGEIWGAVPLPGTPVPAFYLVGIGSYNFTSGSGVGALAYLVIPLGSVPSAGSAPGIPGGSNTFLAAPGRTP